MSTYDLGLWRVAVLPTTIAVYGAECHQFFDVPEKLTPFSDQWADLLRMWRDRRAKARAAQLHREGLTDKHDFMESVKKLMHAGKVTPEKADELITFIHGCDCVPSVVRKKLAAKGFSGIIDQIEFERPHPELERSIDVLNMFLEKIREEQDL